MTKEVYLESQREIEKRRQALNEEKKDLETAYIEAHKPYDVGSRVYSESENAYGIVQGFSIDYFGDIKPEVIKEKKNGELSKFRMYVYTGKDFKFKVKVSELTKEHLAELEQRAKDKIKKYVEENVKKEKSFKYNSYNILVEKKVTTSKFLNFRFVCMNCGTVVDKSTYAIAQLASGNPLVYTCECKHKTTLR